MVSLCCFVQVILILNSGTKKMLFVLLVEQNPLGRNTKKVDVMLLSASLSCFTMRDDVL
jgi:hypothetical protein